MPARERPSREPRVVELVVARRRPEVPHDRLVVLGEQAEAVELVLRPRADVGRGDVPDVGHVEAQQRPERGLREQPADPREPLRRAGGRSGRAPPSRRPSSRRCAVPSNRKLTIVCTPSAMAAAALRTDICEDAAPKSTGACARRIGRTCLTPQATVRYALQTIASPDRGPLGADSMPDGKLNDKRLGWVGAGRMGLALATRLLEAGCDVAVYNRTRSKAEPLAELGATIVDAAGRARGPRHRVHDRRRPGRLPAGRGRARGAAVRVRDRRRRSSSIRPRSRQRHPPPSVPRPRSAGPRCWPRRSAATRRWSRPGG